MPDDKLLRILTSRHRRNEQMAIFARKEIISAISVCLQTKSIVRR